MDSFSSDDSLFTDICLSDNKNNQQKVSNPKDTKHVDKNTFNFLINNKIENKKSIETISASLNGLSHSKAVSIANKTTMIDKTIDKIKAETIIVEHFERATSKIINNPKFIQQCNNHLK
jgi:ribosomal protein L5